MPVGEMTCGPCLADSPAHDGVHAAVAYGETARSLVLKLKYGRKPGHARTIARYLAPRIAGLGEVLLVPVPLHRWRLWSRAFNQSALIGEALADLTGNAMVHALIRTKKTPPLKGLFANERLKALKGAIAMASGTQSRLRGRSVCLIDDVYTSGATANACARVLKRAGASSVHVACWARVLDADGGDY